MKVVQSMNRAADKYPDQVFMTMMVIAGIGVGLVAALVVDVIVPLF